MMWEIEILKRMRFHERFGMVRNNDFTDHWRGSQVLMEKGAETVGSFDDRLHSMREFAATDPRVAKARELGSV